MTFEKPLMTAAWLAVVTIALIIILWLWWPLLLVFASLGIAAVVVASWCIIAGRKPGKEARR